MRDNGSLARWCVWMRYRHIIKSCAPLKSNNDMNLNMNIKGACHLIFYEQEERDSMRNDELVESFRANKYGMEYNQIW